MAQSNLKLGLLSVTNVKLGLDNVSLYLGDYKLYPLGGTPITNAVVTCSSATYDGTAKTALNIIVTLNGNALTYNTDYIIYQNDGGTNAGTYLVIVEGVNLYTGQATGLFEITKADLNASVSMSDWTYGQTASNPSVSGNLGSGTVVYTYTQDGTQYTESKPSDAGNYTIKATISSTQNYNGQSVTDTFTINKADPSYTAPTAKSGLVYTGSAQNLLNEGSTSDGTIQYSSNNNTWNTTIPQSTNASTSITVYWRLVGDNNHNSVNSTSITCSIAKTTPVLSTSPTKTADWTYDGSTKNLASGGAMKRSSTDSTAVAGTFSYATGKNAGSYTATWSFTPTDTTNYNSTSGNVGTVTVSKATGATGVSTSSMTITYSSTTDTRSASGNTGTISASSSSTSIATVSVSGTTITVTRKGYGSATITVTAAASTNYKLASSTFTIYCNKASRSGAVSCSNVEVGSTVTATVSGNTESGTVTWGVTNGTGKATINSSGVVTPTQVGTVTITASVAATTNYAAYTATSKTITITDPTNGHAYVVYNGRKWALEEGSTSLLYCGLFPYGNTTLSSYDTATAYTDNNDPVRKALGGKWRTPTMAEIGSLIGGSGGAYILRYVRNSSASTSNVSGTPLGDNYLRNNTHYSQSSKYTETSADGINIPIVKGILRGYSSSSTPTNSMYAVNSYKLYFFARDVTSNNLYVTLLPWFGLTSMGMVLDRGGSSSQRYEHTVLIYTSTNLTGSFDKKFYYPHLAILDES